MPEDSRPRGQTTRFAHWLDSIVPALYPSNAALAREIGVSRSLIGKWRRGAMPQAPALIRLADATGTSLETLFRITGYRPSPEPGEGGES